MERAIEVLVVDDEPGETEAIAAALLSAGCRVRVAGDGVAALTEVARAAPDLVLSDAGMPRMGGIELAARLRLGPRPVRVALMMGDGDGLRPAGVPCVPKPLDLAGLPAVVARALV